MIRLVAALATALVATPAAGQDSYLVERDVAEGLTPTIATFEYSDRFAVMSVAIDTDAKEVTASALTSPDGIRAWRLSDGRGGRTPKVSGSAARIAYANRAARIAVAVPADAVSGREGMIELSDLSTGRPGPSLRGADDVRDLAFSPDDQVVLAALPEGVRAWDLREGSSLDLFRLQGGAETVSFSAVDEAYVSAQGGAMIYRVRVPDGEILEQWKGKRAGGPIAISSAGHLLAAAGGDGVIKLHDLKAGGKPRSILVGSRVSSLDWAAGGGTLAVGTDDGEVRVYAVDGAEPLPMGFDETPSLAGRGGGVIGNWDGDEDRGAGRLDRVRGEDGASRDRDDRDLRLDLNMGREAGDRVGGAASGGGADGPLAPTESRGPVEVQVEPRVVVLDQMGGDPRNAKNLEATLRKNDKRLTRCWRSAQRAGESVLGTVVYEMGISPDGEGVGIDAPLEDTVGSPKLVECLEGRLRESLFGPGLGSMDIRLQLDFVEKQ